MLSLALIVSSLTSSAGALPAENRLGDYGQITLVINEFMAKNDGFVRDPQGDYDDWIEIYNYGDNTVDIGGLYLTDDMLVPGGWRVPDNNPAATTIKPQGYLLIWADGETNEGILHASFKLSTGGEQIGLFEADGITLIDGVTFGPQAEESSYGRLPDGSDNWQVFDGPTPGKSNKAEPIEVLINEIMYHPYHPIPGVENIGTEYIELFNRGSEPVNLAGWRLSDGVEIVFPDITLGSGEYLVVAADVNSFTAKYPGVTNVIGGWDGRLSNGGEAIELIDDTGVRINRVRYADQGDWAVRELGPIDRNHRGWAWSNEHDGGGKSLELINPALSNECGQNWTASDWDEGTPGTVNSIAADDVAPLILGAVHFPTIPRSNDPVTVTARIFDELTSGITVTLHYRVDTSVYINEGSFPHHDPDTYTHLTMSDNGAYGDGDANDGIYGAQIPAHQADGTIIEFYIEASDDANSRTWPAPAMMDGTPEQVTNALYQVDNSFDPEAYWVPGSQPIYYIIMTEMERARMRDIVSDSNLERPNCQMNVTFISADGVDIKVRYNVGVRNRGHGTRNDWPNNYRVNFAHDCPWKGVTAINLNVVYTWLQLAANAMLQMSGVAQCESTAVQVRTNGENLAVLGGGETYDSYVHLEVIDTDFADNHYTVDDAGNTYKCMRISHEADLRYEGTDPDPYRHNYFKKTNTTEDDWSDLITLTYALSDNTPDETYVEEVNRVMNTEQWLRFIAINVLMNNRETTLANGNGDDYYLYRGIEDPRFVLIQHDLDSVFGLSQDAGSPTDSIFEATDIPTMKRFLEHPQFTSRYYWHLKNLIETTFSAEQLGPFLDNLLAGFVPTSRINQMKTFVAARNAYVLSLIPSALTIETSLPQLYGYYRTTIPSVDISGQIDAIHTRSILVNGVPAAYSPFEGTWSIGTGLPGELLFFLPMDTVWSYEQSNTDLGTAWRAPGYNDSLWPTGKALLYVENAGLPGPKNTPLTIGATTYYFRTHFTFDGDSSKVAELQLSTILDDGAVIYLNDNDVKSIGIDPGTILYSDYADRNVGDATREGPFPISTERLYSGDNVIAVEVHQINAVSTDIVWGMELRAYSAATGGDVPLQPGINRIIVQTFDEPNGAGNELESEYIDIWYDDGYDVDIFGTLASNTTLDAASGPWHVTSDIIVPNGITLTILPGTTLFFEPGTGITVQSGGRFVAEGTQYQRIRLTRVPSSTSPWDGVKFDHTLEDNRLCFIDHEFGDGQGESTDVQDSRVLIDNMTWSGTNSRVLNIDHPSVICRNSVFPSVGGTEPLHGIGLTGDEYIIFDGCIFGTASGYNDIIDFTGAHRPGPIFQLYNSIFLGGSDDGVDLDSTDAHIEGNVFMDFHGGGGGGTANAIATGVEGGDPAEICVVRNIFINNDHAVLLKEDCFLQAENNVFVNSDIAVVSFGEPYRNPPRTPGGGTYMEGNIFWNNAAIFEHFFQGPLPTYGPTGDVVINRSILPSQWHSLGQGNIDADPIFVDPNTDFHPRPSSPAICAGPCGLDMGAYVPGGAAICGEPDDVTHRTDAALIVGGPGITHYKYSVNAPSGPWSEELSVDVPVELTNLVDGESYTVYAIGKNSAGVWQSENNPATSRTWTIDVSHRRLVINEVLAVNISAIEHEGTFPDLIELYYDGPASLNLSGISITDNPDSLTRFVFPAGATIDAGEYLVLCADSETTTSGIHLGFALNGDGEGVYLYDKNGVLLDSVEFGLQLPDLSIGRIGYNGQTSASSFEPWHLTIPTFGRPNVAQPLGNPKTLKINEWFANGEVLFEDDFIELFNPHVFPVELSGLYLTDNPITQPDKHQLGPLSFIAGEGFAVLDVDGRNQPGHVDFRLSADGEMLGLLDAELNEIDKVLYGPQTTDASQGRAPDGLENFEFFELPTPGVANPLGGAVTVTSLIAIDDVWAYEQTDTALPAIWSGPNYNDSSWPTGEALLYVENSNLPAPKNTPLTLGAMTYYFRKHFTLNANPDDITEFELSTVIDDGAVFYINGTEVLRLGMPAGTIQHTTRANRSVGNADYEGRFIISTVLGTPFGEHLLQGENVIAVEVHQTSTGSSDIVFGLQLDAVIITSDESFSEALALLDGLRVTELMYHASENGSDFDFVELQNISQTTLNLTGVRLSEGIDFTFPQMSLEPGQYVVVVSNLAAFRSTYGTGANVAGEYSGSLSNGGENIVLKLPRPLEAAILRFEYSDRWYPTTDGGGNSLMISDPAAHPATWTQPESWQPATPTPGW